MKDIVLASSSPRRKQLLAAVGLTFRVDAPDIPEHRHPEANPAAMARWISLEKATAVGKRNPSSLVIAADTIGVMEGKIIGKPQTEKDAIEMLKSMCGTCHVVITGYSILDSQTQASITRSVETIVCLRHASDAEIESYVRTGEPMDKAGAYAIQGLGAILVSRIEGDYFNVMGLPLSELAESLKEFDINILLEAGRLRG